jgi:aryl-alcohol dehydrogenase-like predicted oxidoreductase
MAAPASVSGAAPLPPIPDTPFARATLGRTGLRVARLGLSLNFGISARDVEEAIEHGMNYVLWYSRLPGEITDAVRRVLQRHRDRVVLASGANFALPFLARRAARSIRKTLGIDQVDVFHLFWVRGEYAVAPRMLDVLDALKQEGAIRFSAVSTHDRERAGRLAREGRLDVLMIRYNAAHRGAERDVFPHLAPHDPAVVAYTATRWGKLLQAPAGWDAARVPPPTAPECYRFVLGNPHVSLVLCGTRSRAELAQNLGALSDGPLAPERHAALSTFGDAVRAGGGLMSAVFERRGILTA